MKHTNGVIRNGRDATREVIESVCRIKDVVKECKLIESLQAKLGHNNSLLASAMARRTELLTVELNGTTKYNVKIGVN